MLMMTIIVKLEEKIIAFKGKGKNKRGFTIIRMVLWKLSNSRNLKTFWEKTTTEST